MLDSDRSALQAAMTRKIERLRMERDHHERLALLADRELQSTYAQYDRI